MRDQETEGSGEPRQKILEIFKEFMTGITKLEELGNASNTFLLRFQQGLNFLKRPPILTLSKLIDNIINNNETKRLKSYIAAGCLNIHDAAQSTRACLSDYLIKAQSLLIDLECLTDEAARVIESATEFSTQLDQESSDESGDEGNAFDITEYATLIAVLYSMVKQNYMMQETIVKSLSLKSSSGEVETYTLMWSLRPFVEDEIMKRAWELIH